MTLTAIVPVPPDSGKGKAGDSAIKPYSGAACTTLALPDTARAADLAVRGKPIPAWADAGIAGHLPAIGDLAPDHKKELPEVLQQKIDWKLFAFRFLLSVATVLESGFCWLTYVEIRNPHYHFYNKLQAYTLGMPGLDKALACVAVLNSFYIFVAWTILVVVKLDVHLHLAMGRLILSCATSTMCWIAVFFSESTTYFPFLSILAATFHLQVVLFGAMLPLREIEPPEKRKQWCKIGIALLAVCFLCWCLMFALDGMAFLREDACRATKNRAMPVRLKGVTCWQCVKWEDPHYIRRAPPTGTKVVKASCGTSFHDFDQLQMGTNGTRVWTPSHAPHYVECPPHCQALGLGVEVLGCRVYDARTAICAAAVQMGIIETGTGGVVKVVGRPAASTYSRCHLRSVVSVQDGSNLPGTETIAEREDANNEGTIPGAFYFQEVEGMKEHDMVTLHGFRKLSTPGPKKPYESYVADVSWRVGGSDLQRREIALGPNAEAEVEVNFCHGSGWAPNSCE